MIWLIIYFYQSRTFFWLASAVVVFMSYFLSTGWPWAWALRDLWDFELLLTNSKDWICYVYSLITWSSRFIGLLGPAAFEILCGSLWYWSAIRAPSKCCDCISFVSSELSWATLRTGFLSIVGGCEIWVFIKWMSFVAVF